MEARPPTQGIEGVIEEGPPFRLERAPSLREAVAHNVAVRAATPTFRVTAELSIEAVQALAKKQAISLTALLARACAAAISADPLFNAAWTGHGLAHRTRVDIGIAIDSPDGLFTPVLRDVAERSATKLAGDWQRLIGKVRAKRLSLSDYRGATFYLSNLDSFKVVQSFDAMVPAGASAVLALASGHAEETFFTLCCDHRVVFGADPARLLETLGDVLASPDALP